MRRKTIGRKMRNLRRTNIRRKTMRRRNIRPKTMKKLIRGGTVNPLAEIGTMFGTINNSLQSVVSSLYVPVTPSYNPSLPISASPSSQFLTNQFNQPISSIYTSSA